MKSPDLHDRFHKTFYIAFSFSAGHKSKESHSEKIPLKDGSKKHKTKAQEKQVDKLEELEKLRNSEKMMDAFLASTAPHNKETNKNERTKTIIKTIRVSQVQIYKLNNINKRLFLAQKTISDRQIDIIFRDSDGPNDEY